MITLRLYLLSVGSLSHIVAKFDSRSIVCASQQLKGCEHAAFIA